MMNFMKAVVSALGKNVLKTRSNDIQLTRDDCSNNHLVHIEGYASVFNVKDEYGDIIRRGAFMKYIKRDSIARNTPIRVLWQHDHTKPIGIAKKIMEDDYGLRVRLGILTTSQYGYEALKLILHNMINGLSIGYIPIRYTLDMAKKCREIEEIRLIEVSVVTFPANSFANISSIEGNK